VHRSEQSLEADQWLLANGPQPVDVVAKRVALCYTVGQKRRAAEKVRKAGPERGYMEPHEAGGRILWRRMRFNKINAGTWIVEDGMIRHRDWTAPVVNSTTHIAIPATIEAVTADLNNVGELVTAKEWQRAAIVATYVQVGEQGVGVHQAGKATSSLSPREFAALGITGLTSKDTVRKYARAWLNNHPRPEPGDTVTLPTDPFPRTRTRERRNPATPTSNSPTARADSDYDKARATYSDGQMSEYEERMMVRITARKRKTTPHLRAVNP
jgi:hypothetical protein